MKVLVLGGNGMLGHKVFQVLRDRFADTMCTVSRSLSDLSYERIDLFRRGGVMERVDAMNLPALGNTLKELQPEVIVNCVGIVKQRDEATSAIPCVTLNSLLPHTLAAWAESWGGRLIHVSTDCVFSGRKGAYREDDPSDAEDLYGKSKFLGEVATRPNALTLRTSIIGRELSSFRSLLEWFLAQRGKTVRGFTRVIYSGVTTNYLAAVVGQLIERHRSLSGLFQVTAPAIDKHALLCMLRDAYSLDVTIVPDDTEVSDRSMVGDAFRRATGLAEPAWQDLVAELASDPTPYDAWRF